MITIHSKIFWNTLTKQSIGFLVIALGNNADKRSFVNVVD